MPTRNRNSIVKRLSRLRRWQDKVTAVRYAALRKDPPGKPTASMRRIVAQINALRPTCLPLGHMLFCASEWESTPCTLQQAVQMEQLGLADFVVHAPPVSIFRLTDLGARWFRYEAITKAKQIVLDSPNNRQEPPTDD